MWYLTLLLIRTFIVIVIVKLESKSDWICKNVPLKIGTICTGTMSKAFFTRLKRHKIDPKDERKGVKEKEEGSKNTSVAI